MCNDVEKVVDPPSEETNGGAVKEARSVFTLITFVGLVVNFWA